MLLFLIWTLYLSLFCMVGLVLVKRWELQSGKVVFAQSRPLLARYLHAIAYFVSTTLPIFARVSAVIIGRRVRYMLRHAIASAILWVERTLERLLKALRHATTHLPHSDAPVSPFLREVVEHKKTLMHRSHKERPGIDE